MEKFFLHIIRHRKLVLVITAVLAVLALISLSGIRLNSDVARYLPDDSISKQTLTMLSEEFGINGDAEICAEGTPENYDELSALTVEIAALDGVDEVQWLGSYQGLFAFENGVLVSAENLVPDENVNSVLQGLYFEYEGQSYYSIIISLEAANATAEAGDTLGLISETIAAYSRPYYLGGTAVQSNNMLESALGEVPMFIIAAGIIIMLILLVTTPTVITALIILVTIGVSILYNLGTNFFTDDISTITFSVAAILQLALSMDYSIFLIHAFSEARKGADDETAMLIALRKTLVVIAASALTTIAGFCALFAMKYTMGFDMGLCLAKGVALSFLTVVFVQPCLMLCLRRASDKTAHKSLNPSFGAMARLPKKLRVAAPAIALALIIPAFILAMSLDYYYLDSGYDPGIGGPKGASQSVGTQSVVVVETVSVEKQLSLAEKIKNLEGVSGVTGYYSMIQDLCAGLTVPVYSSLTEQTDETLIFELRPSAEVYLSAIEGDSSAFEQFVENEMLLFLRKAMPDLIIDETKREQEALGRALSTQEKEALQERVASELLAELTPVVEAQLESFKSGLDMFSSQLGQFRDSFFAEIDGKEYTFFTAKIKGEPEGEEAMSTLSAISYTIKYVMGTDELYISGSTQCVKDLAETTKTDLFIVSGISAVLILIILLFTFKDFLTSILLIVLIELAIFINLSISKLMGGELNFMSYIVISAIQLGATIDYAILMTKSYRQELNDFEPYEAIRRAVISSAFPIAVSVSILCGACLSVYFISSDTIIREVTMLIARGAFISGAMVLLILPAILALQPGRRKKS